MGTSLRDGIAGSGKGRVGIYNFPGNGHIIEPSQIKRGMLDTVSKNT